LSAHSRHSDVIELRSLPSLLLLLSLLLSLLLFLCRRTDVIRNPTETQSNKIFRGQQILVTNRTVTDARQTAHTPSCQTTSPARQPSFTVTTVMPALHLLRPQRARLRPSPPPPFHLTTARLGAPTSAAVDRVGLVRSSCQSQIALSLDRTLVHILFHFTFSSSFCNLLVHFLFCDFHPHFVFHFTSDTSNVTVPNITSLSHQRITFHL
jgi:hypothetical protein